MGLGTGILRGARIEARALNRRLWLGAAVGFTIWLILVRSQQPEGLVRAAPFFWASTEAAVLLLLALLPLVWLASRGLEATVWCLRSSRRPRDGVLMAWFGIACSGALATALCIALVITVNRIYGLPLHGLRCGTLAAEALLFLLPLAALAPGLSYLGLRLHTASLVWALVLGGSFLRGFPVPTGSLLILQGADLNQTRLVLDATLPSGLATVGGLLFSTALARRRLDSPKCESGS